MVQMQAQGSHRQDVEHRNVPDREAGHHIVVDFEVMELTGLEPDEAERQMQAGGRR